MPAHAGHKVILLAPAIKIIAAKLATMIECITSDCFGCLRHFAISITSGTHSVRMWDCMLNAYYRMRVQINHYCQIQPALMVTYLCNISDSNFICLLCNKYLTQAIGRSSSRLAWFITRFAIAAYSMKFVIMHELCYSIIAANQTCGFAIPINTLANTNALASLVELFDFSQQYCNISGATQLRPVLPSILAATANT